MYYILLEAGCKSRIGYTILAFKKQQHGLPDPARRLRAPLLLLQRM
jgi:hypothetical protein